ncbi:MAG: PAS domain S-box protein [Candidatus Methanomethylophilaceae archaeon]|nr:PAS domain S-box protein [Candidatus Methanomethylophilaceae archaeon]
MPYPPPLRGLRILYVDDEPALLELGMTFMESQGGFTVDIADSASAGLEMIGQRSFDAIVSDYQMPEMDGLQLLKHLRAQGNDTPFIIFTGRGREEVAIEALNSGADFYLQKGGNPRAQFAELINMVRQSVQRHRSERLVQEAEVNLRNIVNSMGDGLMVVDTEGRAISYNKAAVAMAGVSTPEDLHGIRIQDFIPPEHLPSFQSFFRQACESGNTELTRFRAVNLQGRSIWLESTNTRTVYEGQDALLIVFRDISDRMELEGRLRDSEEKYRSIVESQRDLICRFLPDTTISFVNQTFCRAFGMTSQELIGRRLMDLLPAEDRLALESILKGVSSPGDIVSNENVMQSLNGEAMVLEWISSGIFDAEGRLTEYQSVGRDTSSFAKAKQSIGVAGKKMQLLCDIARQDIFSRICACRGYLELMETDDGSRPVYAERLEGMLRKMEKDLEFTEHCEKLRDFNPQWCNIYEMVRDNIVSGLRIQNDIKNLEVFADPMLDKALQNICTNAEQHGGNAKSMRISHRQQGDDLVIILEDDGVGVREDMKERIFQRCYERRYGYGLFLIREILSITDIGIRETGEFGQGARFELLVPKERYRKAGDKVKPGLQ